MWFFTFDMRRRERRRHRRDLAPRVRIVQLSGAAIGYIKLDITDRRSGQLHYSNPRRQIAPVTAAFSATHVKREKPHSSPSPVSPSLEVILEDDGSIDAAHGRHRVRSQVSLKNRHALERLRIEEFSLNGNRGDLS